MARGLVIGWDTLKKKRKEKKIDRKVQGRVPIVGKRSFRDSGSRILDSSMRINNAAREKNKRETWMLFSSKFSRSVPSPPPWVLRSS